MSAGLTRLIRSLALMMLIKNLGRHNSEGNSDAQPMDQGLVLGTVVGRLVVDL
jgi:hypothetical protein